MAGIQIGSVRRLLLAVVNAVAAIALAVRAGGSGSAWLVRLVVVCRAAVARHVLVLSVVLVGLGGIAPAASGQALPTLSDGRSVLPLGPADLSGPVQQVTDEVLAGRDPVQPSIPLLSATTLLGLDLEGALGLGREAFPNTLKRRPTLELSDALRSGERVARYYTDFSAQVRDEDGRAALAVSALPLLVERGGEKVPLSMQLEREADGDGWRPRAPYLPTRIGERGSITIEPPGEPALTIRPRFGLGAALQGRVQDGRVVVYGGLSGIDTYVAPVASGSEHLFVVRSRLASEEMALDYELPSDLRLVAGTGGAVEVRRGETRLWRIAAPAAWDAERKRVPAHYRIEGNRLVVHVDHHHSQVRHPVLVDPPTFNDVAEAYFWNAAGETLPPPDTPRVHPDYGNWVSGEVSNIATSRASGSGCSPIASQGLCMGFFALPAGAAYVSGALAFWRWPASNVIAGTQRNYWVTRADILNLQHRANLSRVEVGLQSGPSGGFKGFYGGRLFGDPPSPSIPNPAPFSSTADFQFRFDLSVCQASNCDITAGNPGDGLLWRLRTTQQTPAGGYTGAHSFLGGAFLFLQDDERPVFDGSTIAASTLDSGGWVDSYDTNHVTGGQRFRLGIADNGPRLLNKAIPDGMVRPGLGGKYAAFFGHSSTGPGQTAYGGVTTSESTVPCAAAGVTSSATACPVTAVITGRLTSTGGFEHDFRTLGSGSPLPDGNWLYGLTGYDLTAHETLPHQWRIRLDRRAPSLTGTSGPLWNDQAPATSTTLALRASDGSLTDGASAQAGVRDVVIAAGPLPPRTVSGPGSCDASCEVNTEESFDLADGDHQVTITVRDRVRTRNGSGELATDAADGTLRGRHTTSQTKTVTVDRQPPSISVAGHAPDLSAWAGANPRTVTLGATDAGAGVQRLRVSVVSTGAVLAEETQSCGGPSRAPCARSVSGRTLQYPTSGLPEGQAVALQAVAIDATGKTSAPVTWNVRVDRTPPTAAVDPNPVAGSDLNPVVTVSGTDAVSGSARIVTRLRQLPSGQATVIDDYTVPCSPNCPTTRVDRPVRIELDRYQSGRYELSVIVTDQAGNVSSPAVREVVVLGTGGADPNKLGLEQWYSYDTTETGAGSQLHVNAASGNAVWRLPLFANPGRGFSTVAAVTYNSQDRAEGLGQVLGDTSGLPIIGPSLPDLGGSVYDQVGPGFSLSIASVTRVNEPLIGVADANGAPRAAPASIKLVDGDGTHHVFTLVAGSSPPRYQEPPGVQLHLRQQPAAPANERWAATRPDGTTFLFDAQGYQTFVKDRDNNRIRLEYETFNGLTAQPYSCNPGLLDALAICVKRLRRVVDAEGVDPSGTNLPNGSLADRTVRLTYVDDPEEGGSGPSPLAGLGGLLPGVQQLLALRFGRIASIHDHADRITRFDYDSQNTFLEAIIVAQGAGERRFDLRYVGSGNTRYLTEIEDPKNQTTRLAYEPVPDAANAPNRAESVSNRRDKLTSFDYALEAGGRVFTATAPLGQLALPPVPAPPPAGRITRHELDGRGRPLKVTEGYGMPEASATAMEWDADHNTTKITRAADTADASAETFTYDSHGLVLTHTEDVKAIPGSNPTTRVTTYSFRYGTEPAAPTFVVDQPGVTYVADLTRIQRPETFVSFVVSNTGNVTERSFDGAAPAVTTYDTRGRITMEASEVGDRHTYHDFEGNGLPQLVIDGRGNATVLAGDGEWRYRYDKTGNTLHAADPRATAIGPGVRHTTSYGYDKFDQLTSSSTSQDADTFIARAWTYDLNGNQERHDITQPNGVRDVDGNAEPVVDSTLQLYNEMDQLREARSPKAPHLGTEQGSQWAEEITSFEYDDRDNLIREIAPKGHAGSTDGDFETRTRYDALDRPIITRRMARGTGGNEDLVTSMAYDRRGNLTGLVDPRGNRANGGGVPNDSDPIANLTVETRRRFTYKYDLLDRRVEQIEAPGRLDLKTTWTYDDNDRLRTLVKPRGFAAGANAAAHTATYAYDGRDLVTLVTESVDATNAQQPELSAQQRVTRYDRRPDGVVERLTRPKGMATGAGGGDYEITYTYNANQELEQWTLPERGDAPHEQAIEPVVITRNPVGDPEEITDARGHHTVNSFYDTGELKSTTRPFMWQVQLNGDGPELAPKPYEEWSRTAPPLEKPDSEGEGDNGAVDPQPPAALLPRAGLTEFRIDANGRVRWIEDVRDKVTVLKRDPVGRLTRLDQPLGPKPNSETDQRIVNEFAYDLDGNQVQTRAPDITGDGQPEITRTSYDQFERPIETSAPGALPTAPDPGTNLPDVGHREITRTEYDANGNPVKQHLPRDADGNPADPNVPTDELLTSSTFDPADREDSMRDARGGRTTYAYDQDGNRTCQRSPRGNTATSTGCTPGPFATTSTYNEHGELAARDRQRVDDTDGDGDFDETALNLRWTYERDRHGNVIRETAPGAHSSSDQLADANPYVTTRVFDGRDLLWKQTSGADSGSPLTTWFEHDANGNLRRTVNPKGLNGDQLPAGQNDTDQQGAPSEAQQIHATVNVYSADNLLIDRWLPFKAGELSGPRVHQSFDLDERGRISKIEHPFRADGTVKTVNSTYTHYENGWIKTQTDSFFENAGPGDKTEYTYDLQGNQTLWRRNSGRQTRRDFWPNGMLARRTAKKSDTDPTERSYGYAYNPTRALVALDDHDLDHLRRVDRDELDRVQEVNEAWDSGKDSEFDYDPDSNLTRLFVETNASPTSEAGKTSTYRIDSTGLERRMRTTVDGQSDTRALDTSYWPSGQRLRRDKDPGAVEKWNYDAHGRIVRRIHGTATDQAYTYDDNGNRTKDEKGTYDFNALHQMTRWTKPSGEHSEYLYTPSGARFIQADKNAQGTQIRGFFFDSGADDKLRVVTETQPGQPNKPTHYRYERGNLVCAGSTSATDPSCPGGATFSYDDFDRQIAAKNGEAGSETSTFTYDGLDRRDTRCASDDQPTTGGCQGGTSTDYSYVGLTDQLASERSGSGEQETYDYSSALERIALDRTPDTGSSGTHSYRPYVKDAQGTVLGLEQGTAGDVPAADTYTYDPYGQTEEKPGASADAKANSFRYQGFYYEQAGKTYDTPARPYKPDIGGRYTTADRYEGSTGDLALQQDPLTQHRYAFLAANPVTGIEYDGHIAPDSVDRNNLAAQENQGGGGSTRRQGGPSPTVSTYDRAAQAPRALPVKKRVIVHKAALRVRDAVCRECPQGEKEHNYRRAYYALSWGIDPAAVTDYVSSLDYSDTAWLDLTLVTPAGAGRTAVAKAGAVAFQGGKTIAKSVVARAMARPAVQRALSRVGAAKPATGGIGPVLKGQAGVRSSIDEAIAAGERLRGTEITVQAANSGRRVRLDYLTEVGGRIVGTEVKTGPYARLSTRQREIFEELEQFGGTFVGGNAERAGLRGRFPARPIRRDFRP